jgi:hypothetical protein
LVSKVHIKQEPATQKASWDFSRLAARHINIEFFDKMGLPGPTAQRVFEQHQAPPTRKKMMDLLGMARKLKRQALALEAKKLKAEEALARKVMQQTKQELKALAKKRAAEMKLQLQISKYGLWMMTPRWLPSADASVKAVVPAASGAMVPLRW